MTNNTPSEHISEELLTDYYHGILEEEAVRRIRNHLNRCEQCSAVLEGIRYLNESKEISSWSYLGDLLNKQLTLLPKDKDNKGVSRNFFSSTVFKIAAAMAILIVAVVVLVFTSSRSGSEMVQTHLEDIYPPPPVPRSQENTSREEWSNAISSYRSGDYDEAYRLIMKSLEQGGYSDIRQFYSGLCLLYQNEKNPPAAVRAFKTVILHNGRYAEQARWYLALAHYLNDDPAASRQVLDAIIQQEEHFKKEEAEVLLEKLSQ